MSGLTHEQRGRMVKGFLMVSGGIALAMVLFALIGQLGLMTIILVVVGAVIAAISIGLWIAGKPLHVACGVFAVGMGVIVGAAGGYFIINTVISLLH